VTEIFIVLRVGRAAFFIGQQKTRSAVSSMIGCI